MALDYAPTNLLQEADAAIYHRDKYLRNKKELLQTFMGAWFRNDKRPSRESPENYPFSYVANVKPKIVFDNPKVTAKSTNVSVDAATCVHTGRAVNQWIKYVDFVNTLDIFATDGLIMWSVILTEFKTHPDDEDIPDGQLRRMLPACTVLENHRYFRDPTSTPAVRPRYEGHICVEDLEDLKQRKDIDKKALDKIIVDMDLAILQRPNARAAGMSDTPSRKEVLYYEIWVPECHDYRTPGLSKHLENGTIFTIAIGQATMANGTTRRIGNATYLRKPRPFFGPKEGPYSTLGFYDVPEETYWLSPIAVCMQQVEEVNAHATAVANAASRMKNLVFVDAAQDTLANAVMNSPDGTVVGIANIAKDQIIPVTVGGPAPEQLQYIQLLRERLDRNIGIDDAQRGELNPQVTATATNVAFQSASVRMSELIRKFKEAVKKVLRSVAWYAWESPNFVLFLAPEDAEELRMQRPAFLGGPEQPQPGQPAPKPHVPFDQAALDIEPYSMVKVDEAVLAQEVMDTLALVVQMAQEMQTAPWIGWKTILDQIADIRKFDWLPDAINSDLFIAYTQQAQAQQSQTHAMAMQMQQLQIQQLDLDNKLKQVELMTKLKALQQGPGEEDDKPSVSMNYADVPEDIKRRIEAEATGASSRMPLTAKVHIQGAAGMVSQNATQAHQSQQTAGQQQHQQGLAAQSKLATMLRDMAKAKASSAQHRRQSPSAPRSAGPAKTPPLSRPQPAGVNQ